MGNLGVGAMLSQLGGRQVGIAREWEGMSKRKIVGYGYVGEWANGDLGWFLPRHLYGKQNNLKHPSQPRITFLSMKGERGVLCKITIEEIPGRRRRTVKE